MWQSRRNFLRFSMFQKFAAYPNAFERLGIFLNAATKLQHRNKCDTFSHKIEELLSCLICEIIRFFIQNWMAEFQEVNCQTRKLSDVCVTVHRWYNDVSSQQDAKTFSFINLFKSALHVSGDKFANSQECFLTVYTAFDDRLCGLVVRVSGYRYRGLGFHSRRYQIFWVVVGLERGPLSLLRSIEELLE